MTGTETSCQYQRALYARNYTRLAWPCTWHYIKRYKRLLNIQDVYLIGTLRSNAGPLVVIFFVLYKKIPDRSEVGIDKYIISI